MITIMQKVTDHALIGIWFGADLLTGYGSAYWGCTGRRMSGRDFQPCNLMAVQDIDDPIGVFSQKDGSYM